MKKLLLSLAVLMAVILVPATSISKGMAPETITITGNNLLVLNGVVEGDSVGPIIVKAKELDQKNSGKMGRDHSTPLYLYLNTPGGNVQSGLELREALIGLGRPVYTITAFAASMGFQLVQGLGTRYILDSGILMSHRAAGQFSGSFGGTSPSQLDSRMRLWTQITKEMDEVTVAHTNGKQTLESYQKAYNQELWVTGKESVVLGYADAVIKIKCGEGLTGTTKHEVEFMGLQVTYELDSCPINTSPMNIHVSGAGIVSQEYSNRVKEQFLSGYQMKMSTPLPMVF